MIEKDIKNRWDETVWKVTSQVQIGRMSLRDAENQLNDVFNCVLNQHQELINRLEQLTKTRSHKLKIGQNEYARTQLKLTEKQIDDHNNYCEGWDDGYADAKEEVLQALAPIIPDEDTIEFTQYCGECDKHIPRDHVHLHHNIVTPTKTDKQTQS